MSLVARGLYSEWHGESRMERAEGKILQCIKVHNTNDGWIAEWHDCTTGGSAVKQGATVSFKVSGLSWFTPEGRSRSQVSVTWWSASLPWMYSQFWFTVLRSIQTSLPFFEKWIWGREKMLLLRILQPYVDQTIHLPKVMITLQKNKYYYKNNLCFPSINDLVQCW